MQQAGTQKTVDFLREMAYTMRVSESDVSGNVHMTTE